MLGEKRTALHRALGRRSHLLLNEQPPQKEARDDQNDGGTEDKLRSERDEKL